MLATSTRHSRRQPSCNESHASIGVVLVPILYHANTGQSALQFQRQFGLKRYETAFEMLHRLCAGLVRPERIRLAISTQLRWMNRSWAGVQKVKGVFTIRQSSLERLRYVPKGSR